MSASPVTIKPNSNLCELQEVKVLGSADVDHSKAEKAQAQQHHVQTETQDNKIIFYRNPGRYQFRKHVC